MQDLQQIKPRFASLHSLKQSNPKKSSITRYSPSDFQMKYSCLTSEKLSISNCDTSSHSYNSTPIPRLAHSYIDSSRKNPRTYRITANPSVLTKRRSKSSSKDVYEYLFPNWLKERKDFQDAIKKLSTSGQIDIIKACDKHFLLRHKIEKNALLEWAKEVPFFQNLGKHTTAEVCNQLRTAHFAQGQELICEGSVGNELYILIKGKVEVFKNISEFPITEIAPKNVIGEQALITGSLRNATIKAKEPTTVFVLSKEDYSSIVLKQKQKERFQNIYLLRGIPLLQDWPTVKVNQLASSLFSVHYEKDAIIYNFEEKPNDFYILKEGRVCIEVIVNNQKGNRWPIKTNEWQIATTTSKYLRNIRICNRGDYFGEKELILDIPRRSRAVSRSDNTELLVLSGEIFGALFNEADKKYLESEFSKRPNTRELELCLSRELREVRATVDNYISVSSRKELADGRNLYNDQKTRRKLKWIKGLVSRTKHEHYKDFMEARTDTSKHVSSNN